MEVLVHYCNRGTANQTYYSNNLGVKIEEALETSDPKLLIESGARMWTLTVHEVF